MWLIIHKLTMHFVNNVTQGLVPLFLFLSFFSLILYVFVSSSHFVNVSDADLICRLCKVFMQMDTRSLSNFLAFLNLLPCCYYWCEGGERKWLKIHEWSLWQEKERERNDKKIYDVHDDIVTSFLTCTKHPWIFMLSTSQFLSLSLSLHPLFPKRKHPMFNVPSLARSKGFVNSVGIGWKGRKRESESKR